MGVGVMEEAATVAGSTKPPSMTYVQADASNFREVVQRLTGPSRNDDIDDGAAAAAAATAARGVVGVKRPAVTLHERRQYARLKLHEIVKPLPPPLPADFHVDHHSYHQPQQPQQPQQQQFNFFPSPPGNGCSGASVRSPIGTPSSIFSRLTIVEEEEQEEEEEEEEEETVVLNREEEENAIRERRFYLHPSPRSKPGFTEPELLTLFPLTSPKTSS